MLFKKLASAGEIQAQAYPNLTLPYYVLSAKNSSWANKTSPGPIRALMKSKRQLDFLSFFLEKSFFEIQFLSRFPSVASLP